MSIYSKTSIHLIGFQNDTGSCVELYEVRANLRYWTFHAINALQHNCVNVWRFEQAFNAKNCSFCVRTNSFEHFFKPLLWLELPMSGMFCYLEIWEYSKIHEHFEKKVARKKWFLIKNKLKKNKILVSCSYSEIESGSLYHSFSLKLL